jgi:hypothetical protein
MRNCFFFFIFFCSLSSFSQINLAKETDYNDFMKTTTMVVMDANPFTGFNQTLVNAVEAFWKITPYEVISNKEFSVKKKVKNNSFIILSEASMEVKGKILQYKMLNLVLGGKAANLNEMPDLASVPLSYIDADDEEYLYKLGGVLQFMQFFVRYNLENPNTDIFKLVQKIEGNVGDKEIWLLHEEVANEINTTEKLKKYYQGKVKFATKDEIEAAILKKDDKVLFLHKIGSEENGSICWKFLIEAATGKAVYFSQDKVGSNTKPMFCADDFKKLK